jgi:4-hydroxy-3-polyprenylbenzoate decarboxylase
MRRRLLQVVRSRADPTVERLGELKRVSGAHWDVEMGAVTHMLTEKSGGTAPAILFDDVPGYRKGYRTLYGQLSSVKRIALTLGLPLQYERKVDIVQRYHARMQDLRPLPPAARDRRRQLGVQRTPRPP